MPLRAMNSFRRSMRISFSDMRPKGCMLILSFGIDKMFYQSV